MDAPEPTGRLGALVQLLSPRRRRASGSEDVPVDQQPAHHDSDNTNPGMQDIPSAGGSPTFAPPSARDTMQLATSVHIGGSDASPLAGGEHGSNNMIGNNAIGSDQPGSIAQTGDDVLDPHAHQTMEFNTQFPTVSQLIRVIDSGFSDDPEHLQDVLSNSEHFKEATKKKKQQKSRRG